MHHFQMQDSISTCGQTVLVGSANESFAKFISCKNMKEKKTVSCSMENSLSMNTGRIIKGTRRKNKECEVNQTGPEGLNGGKIKNRTEDGIHRCLNSEGRRDHNKHPRFQIYVSSPYISGNI